MIDLNHGAAMEVTAEMIWRAVRAYHGYTADETLPDSVKESFEDMCNAIEAALEK